MKNQKILVDRERLSKKFIQSKQEFGEVLSYVKKLKSPVWKTPWFYGPIGLASIAVSISVVSINPTEVKSQIVELKQNSIPISEKKTSIKSDNYSLPVSLLIEETKTPIREKAPVKKEEVNLEFNQHTIEELKSEEKATIAKLESKQEVLSKPMPLYPNIDGAYNGEITLEQLRSDNGIKCGKLVIKSFSIQYFNGSEEKTRSVIGSIIPKDIVQSIADHNWGSMIFITKIMATDIDGSMKYLPSMNFIPH